MKESNKKVIDALERAIKAGDECYYAFNDLSCETDLHFRFYATDLYKAITFCKALLKGLEQED